MYGSQSHVVPVNDQDELLTGINHMTSIFNLAFLSDGHYSNELNLKFCANSLVADLRARRNRRTLEWTPSADIKLQLDHEWVPRRLKQSIHNHNIMVNFKPNHHRLAYMARLKLTECV